MKTNMQKYTRRDFLKLASAVTLGSIVSPLAPALKSQRSNIVIILFDAMTARNLSLYGYERATTPNLSKFAERANVYYQHYTAGNFTTPGTASLLTGMYPWKHRAFNQGGLIQADLLGNNPFTLLGDEYYRLAFSQNPWPDRLAGQFYQDVDKILSPTSYSLRSSPLVMDHMGKDRSLSSIAVEEFLFSMQADTVGSALLGYIYKSLTLRDVVAEQNTHVRYPHGIPEMEGYIVPYLNEDIYRGVLQEILGMESQAGPYFAYFHLFSPHSPYKPRKDFLKLFQDDYQPTVKPAHPLGSEVSDEELLNKRTAYDQQIAQVDFEFGNLISELDSRGILDHCYLILTSDHGEMFERGYAGHGWLLMYEANIHIPLLIHTPGQTVRKDIYEATSNADVLPTLLSAAGKNIPEELDGQVLPGFGGTYDLGRPIFSMYSVENSAFAPIKKAAVAMRKGNYKLISYLGYENFDGVHELYDLENDPEELVDISKKETMLFNSLKDEFLTCLAKANQPYVR